MRFERATLSPLTWSLLIVAVALLALPTVALAGSDGMEPALEAPQTALEAPRAGAEAAEGVSPVPALTTPETGEQVELSVGEGATPSLLPNPCYQFDKPQYGCYYSWRPSDLCCISPAPWCPAICY
jgi:hypothetical protein